MSRLTVAIASLALTIPTAVLAQTPVTVEEDVIFSRTLGSAILADIAYPVDSTDLPVIMYVHGGRWGGGTRVNDSGLQVAQWAGMGFFAMTIDYLLGGHRRLRPRIRTPRRPSVGCTRTPTSTESTQTAST